MAAGVATGNMSNQGREWLVRNVVCLSNRALRRCVRPATILRSDDIWPSQLLLTGKPLVDGHGITPLPAVYNLCRSLSDEASVDLDAIKPRVASLW